MGQTKSLISYISTSNSRLFTIASDEDTGPCENNRTGLVDSEAFIRNAFARSANEGITLLFERYYQPLCNHAVRYVSSREIAEDIVSDLFYELQSKEIFKTVTSSFRAFLFTAVRNRAFDYVRLEMNRSTSLEQAGTVSIPIGQHPDTVTQFEELYHDVEKSLNQLPIQRRRVYIMHRFEGKKYSEIAKDLNLSVKTVEAHMAQAMHQMRKAMIAKWTMILLIACNLAVPLQGL
ncbi:RNA polymerase sigma-70 factor [Spirosoma lituiforme]